MSHDEQPSTAPPQANASAENLVEQAEALFGAGDHLRAGRLARRVLAEGSDDDALRAQLLLDRLRPDPLVKYLIFASAVLLLLLTILAYRASGS